MIKKNLILAFSFATIISGAFADTCPRGPAVCMRTNDDTDYVCKVLGNDGKWYQAAGIVIPSNAAVINFPFTYAMADSHQPPSCNYVDENHPDYGTIYFTTNTHLTADIHAVNNKWQRFNTISSFICQGMSVDACPFKAW